VGVIVELGVELGVAVELAVGSGVAVGVGKSVWHARDTRIRIEIMPKTRRITVL
jgi:hypothetical protein